MIDQVDEEDGGGGDVIVEEEDEAEDGDGPKDQSGDGNRTPETSKNCLNSLIVLHAELMNYRSPDTLIRSNKIQETKNFSSENHCFALLGTSILMK